VGEVGAVGEVGIVGMFGMEGEVGGRVLVINPSVPLLLSSSVPKEALSSESCEANNCNVSLVGCEVLIEASLSE
jgi:hypothetical protein